MLWEGEIKSRTQLGLRINDLEDRLKVHDRDASTERGRAAQVWDVFEPKKHNLKTLKHPHLFVCLFVCLFFLLMGGNRWLLSKCARRDWQKASGAKLVRHA